jgi:restriction system protein
MRRGERSFTQGGNLKFRMARNSLFAVLLRSRWWISAAIALALALLGLAVLAEPFRSLAILSGCRSR